MMHAIIIGCGRLGGNLAKELSDDGHDVCIIDRSAERFAVLGGGFNGRHIKGIEFDSDILAEAGIKKADALLAVTPDDNINITVALIAERIYRVPKIIARINDPGRRYIYEKLNIETISLVRLGVRLLKNRLTEKSCDVVAELGNGYEIIELCLDKAKIFTVKDVEAKFSCVISGVLSEGSFNLPQRDSIIQTGDHIFCTVHKNDKARLTGSLSKEIQL